MPRDQVNRREFLRAAAAGVGAGILVGAGGRVARAQAAAGGRVAGANERIRMGIIGSGGMGRNHMRILKEKHPDDVEFVAICDIYTAHSDAAKEIWPKADVCVDYRELLDRKDIDAVLIASPEHWHHNHLIDAVRAGKDAYCEKPMAWSLQQCDEMVKAVRKTDRIVQIGMQRRSTSSIIEAKKLVEAGKLGDVALVRAWWYWNLPHLRPLSEEKLYGTLDWEKFQAPCAPKDRVPFAIRRYKYWRYFWPYSGGNMTDQGTHLMDVVQWFMNDGEPPLAAQEHGAVYQQEGYETPDTFCAVFEYPKFMATWTLTYTNNYEDAWGICFQGNKGTLLLDDDGAKLFGEPWKAKNGVPPEPIEKVPGGLQVDAHWDNFLACVKSRQQPHATVEVGQKAVAGLHLANVAHHKKRRAELARDYVTVKV